MNLQGTILVVAFIILLLVCFIGFVLVIFYYKRKKLQVELNEQFSQTLLQSQIEIQEQTLQHLSRELHDNFGQVASLIKINLNTLQWNDPEKAAQKIEATKDLTRQLIADIKSLSVSLGSDRIAQAGLDNALKTEVERLNKTGEFVASFELEGQMPAINNDKSVILYRMAQEILNNMVKHSDAKQIHLLLQGSVDCFKLVFSDNGIGFVIDEKLNATGAGLRNLYHRAQLINARLDIKSSPGAGTLITIELPL